MRAEEERKKSQQVGQIGFSHLIPTRIQVLHRGTVRFDRVSGIGNTAEVFRNECPALGAVRELSKGGFMMLGRNPSMPGVSCRTTGGGGA